MEVFCTLFDCNYLSRGLALHESLVKCGEPFSLWVYCMDQEVENLLMPMNLSSLKIIPLQKFENAELKKLKQSRTAAEYCWTCTPQILLHCRANSKADRVTYLDADLYFFSSFRPLIDELVHSGKDVLITEHRYAPRYDQSKTSGRFCVQFMTFNASENAKQVLNWWAQRCLEWCYARFEDGKFGDQKYLDTWPEQFEKIHILEHLGGGVAPWNLSMYRVTEGPKVNDIPVVFYHFHGFSLFKEGGYDPAGSYRVPPAAKELIFDSYYQALGRAYKKIQRLSPGFFKGQNPRFSSMSYKFFSQAKHQLAKILKR